MSTIAVDTLIRANQSGLGTASDGINVWGSPTNGATANVASNEAVISNCVSGFPVIFLGSGTTADIDFLVRCSQQNNIFDGIGPCFRAVDANNLYFVAFYAGTGGLIFAKIVSGSFSSLATGSFSLSNNQESVMRVRMIGNHLQVFAWVDGGSQPGTPQIDTTDASYSSAGQFGMSFNTFASGSDTVTFDTITVTDGTTVTTSTRTIPTSAALLTTSQRTVSTSAVLKTTLQRSIGTSAVLQTTNARVVPTSAVIQTTNARSVPTSAALLTTQARTIGTSAALQTTSTRTVSTTAVLLTTTARTIPTSAVLAANARVIPTSAVLQTTKARTIPCSAVLSTGVALPTANVVILMRGGDATVLMRSGDATVTIRE